jgi:hypothetical protein
MYINTQDPPVPDSRIIITRPAKPNCPSTMTTNGSSTSRAKNWVPILEQSLHTPRKLRLVTVGAGINGLILAHKIQHNWPGASEWIDHQIYEKKKCVCLPPCPKPEKGADSKKHEVGGTWLENTYPGIACDIPAVSPIQRPREREPVVNGKRGNSISTALISSRIQTGAASMRAVPRSRNTSSVWPISTICARTSSFIRE